MNISAALPGSNCTSEPGLVPVSEIELVPLAHLAPARLNNVIYNPVRTDDPAVRGMAAGLAETIRRFGVEAIDPLVATLDDVLVSGHRRQAALSILGEEVAPLRRLPILSTDPEFEKVLVRYNDQRYKDPAERVREQLVLADPEEVYRAVQSHRAQKARVSVAPLELGKARKRHAISKAKRPFLDASKRVVSALEDYWPLSDRRVHYALSVLPEPPLKHASKPDSRYTNDKVSYKSLCDLLTRARLVGEIPFDAIGDEIRPVTTWAVYPNLAPFVATELEDLFTGYNRNLMIGQPNQVEIVGEKLTIEGIIRPVASHFCIPYTIGRGYSSLPPRKAMFDRYRASGKEKLVILFITDHDPEGADIPESYARSMRDDFGVRKVHPIKVALTPEQVVGLKLPTSIEAKTTSSRFKRFAAKYGRFAYELEAVPPDLLRQWLRDAITSVIDVDQFNKQVELEKREQATAAVFQKEAINYLRKLTRPTGNESGTPQQGDRP